MRLFDDTTGFEAARDDARYTLAMLKASKQHPAQNKLIERSLGQWQELDSARTRANDAVLDANARVALCDFKLDVGVRAIAKEAEYEGGRDGAMFRAIFPEPPSDVTAQTLAPEIEAVKQMSERAKAAGTPSKALAKALSGALAACADGEEALKAREEAVLEQARWSIRAADWKSAANKARRAVHNQLDAHAIEHDLGADYADLFFPAARKPAKGRGKGGGGNNGGGAEPEKKEPTK